MLTPLGYLCEKNLLDKTSIIQSVVCPWTKEWEVERAEWLARRSPTREH